MGRFNTLVTTPLGELKKNLGKPTSDIYYCTVYVVICGFFSLLPVRLCEISVTFRPSQVRRHFPGKHLYSRAMFSYFRMSVYFLYEF